MTMLALLWTQSQTWMAEHCLTLMKDLSWSRRESISAEVEGDTAEVAADLLTADAALAEKETKIFVTTATKVVTGK